MHDEWDDDLDDESDEFAGSENWADDSDDDAETVACPNCGAQVYEDAELCPACDEFIVHGQSVWDDKPGWWVILGFLGIVATIIVLVSY